MKNVHGFIRKVTSHLIMLPMLILGLTMLVPILWHMIYTKFGQDNGSVYMEKRRFQKTANYERRTQNDDGCLRWMLAICVTKTLMLKEGTYSMCCSSTWEGT